MIAQEFIFNGTAMEEILLAHQIAIQNVAMDSKLMWKFVMTEMLMTILVAKTTA